MAGRGGGLAAVTQRMLELLSAPRAAALAEGPVTIDWDATDVEVYGRKKRGVAFNHQGQRVGRPHVAPRAETEIVLAAATMPEARAIRVTDALSSCGPFVRAHDGNVILDA